MVIITLLFFDSLMEARGPLWWFNLRLVVADLIGAIDIPTLGIKWMIVCVMAIWGFVGGYCFSSKPCTGL